MRDYFEVLSSAEWVLLHAYFHRQMLASAIDSREGDGTGGVETDNATVSVRARRQQAKKGADAKKQKALELERQFGGMCGTATVVFQSVAR